MLKRVTDRTQHCGTLVNFFCLFRKCAVVMNAYLLSFYAISQEPYGYVCKCVSMILFMLFASYALLVFKATTTVIGEGFTLLKPCVDLYKAVFVFKSNSKVISFSNHFVSLLLMNPNIFLSGITIQGSYLSSEH